MLKLSVSLRNFIWSTTSWKRGLTCQQHSTTTQPSRPSKAQPVQRPQLFLYTTPLSRRDEEVHTAWFFYSSRIWLFDCRGSSPPLKLPCIFKFTSCPKTPTNVLFLFFMFLLFFGFFFLLSCFEQGLCYVYVSESEACFFSERRTDLVAQGSDRTKVILCIYTKC